MPRKRILVPILLSLLLVSLSLLPARTTAQAGYQPAPENLAARHWFQDAKFGLSIHWGVYSVLGDGEWVMNNRKIPIHDYQQAPRRLRDVRLEGFRLRHR